MLKKDPGKGGQFAVNRDVLAVSDVNRKAKQLLETHFANVWVQGELSNFARPQSGHWYFTLKDSKAQLRCALFRNRNQLLRYKPREGEQVLVRGRLSLYEGRGDYQLIAEFMEPAGEGALRLAFEELQHRLQDEGLFDPAGKLPLPQRPSRIAVITSLSGAALHDFLSVMRRRSASVSITILPVIVQGAQAAGQIVEALQLANAGHAECSPDVIVLTRGGGSIEDLWPFNEETVARAIAASDIPVVSAVGHETDVTISDFVADLRAPTPSAAAELLSYDDASLIMALQQREHQLTRLIRGKISVHRQLIDRVSRQVRHPQQRLEELAQRGDYLQARLNSAAQNQLARYWQSLERVAARLISRAPATAIESFTLQLRMVSAALRHAMTSTIRGSRAATERCASVLDAVSPLATLARGYAIVRNAEQRVVRVSSEVQPGDTVSATLSAGQLKCEVKEIT